MLRGHKQSGFASHAQLAKTKCRRLNYKLDTSNQLLNVPSVKQFNTQLTEIVLSSVLVQPFGVACQNISEICQL